jgi:hypothetical protein
LNANTKRKKLYFGLKDVMMPSFFLKNDEDLKIFDNFEKWVDTMLSLEVILQSVLDMEILKHEWIEFMESCKNKTENKFKLKKNEFQYKKNFALDKFFKKD